MARSISEIQASIQDSVNSTAELSVLNNVSATSIYKLIILVVAHAIKAVEVIADQMRAETIELLGTQRLHGAQYYIDMIKDFQYSDETIQAIVLDDYYIPKWEVPNDDLKIITSVALREANRKIFVKVNKGEPGALQVLTSAELKSLKNYVHLLKDMGTQIEVESLPAESLRVKMQIDFNQSYGNLTEANVQSLVNAYLVQMGFDNKFSIQGFEAALLADVRIIDLQIESLVSYSSTGVQSAEIYSLQNGVSLKTYLTQSGHMILDSENSQFTLNATV